MTNTPPQLLPKVEASILLIAWRTSPKWHLYNLRKYRDRKLVRIDRYLNGVLQGYQYWWQNGSGAPKDLWPLRKKRNGARRALDF